MPKIQVACKLPNGLVLRLFKMEDAVEPSPNGGRKIKIAREDVDAGRVTLNGCAVPFGADHDYRIINGYSLTLVDTDFWKEWLIQNKDAEVVKKNLVFAHEKTDDVQAQIKDQNKGKLRSGLEAIDPRNPPLVGIKPVKVFKQKAEEEEAA